MAGVSVLSSTVSAESFAGIRCVRFRWFCLVGLLLLLMTIGLIDLAGSAPSVGTAMHDGVLYEIYGNALSGGWFADGSVLFFEVKGG